MERAVEIINQKNEDEKKKVIRDYGDIKILNGKYGPYISRENQNYRIPKGADAEKLTREECLEIIEKTAKSKKSS